MEKKGVNNLDIECDTSLYDFADDFMYILSGRNSWLMKFLLPTELEWIHLKLW